MSECTYNWPWAAYLLNRTGLQQHQASFHAFSLTRSPFSLVDASFQSVAAFRPGRRTSMVVRANSDPMLQKPSAPTPPSESPEKAPVVPIAPTGPSSGVSIEYQRKQAKAMQQYFKDQAFEEVVADAK